MREGWSGQRDGKEVIQCPETGNQKIDHFLISLPRSELPVPTGQSKNGPRI